MSAITAEAVRELREKTSAGIMDCKRALAETEGDMEKAVLFLREKGLAAAAKKATRGATDGLVSSYIHAGGKIGVLIEVNCETDFVARTEEFQDLVRDLAMHVAASAPVYVSKDEVPESALETERSVFRAQAAESGKPANVVEKMVEGKVQKYYTDVCLLEQAFVKDPQRSVGQLVTDAIAKIGENIVVRRFARFQLGDTAE